MSPPHDRPKEGSLPLGGTARSAKGAHHRSSLAVTTLRVRLDAPWERSRAAPWVLFGWDGEALSSGSTPASEWPAHDHLELVIGAAQTRVIRVQLPAMAATRVAAAVRFAIEDQVVGSDAPTHIAVSDQRADGAVLATLVPLAFMPSRRHRGAALAKLRRVVAEPELAVPQAEPLWRWCSQADGEQGFVRLPDGTAFPVGAPEASGTLPPELRLALAQRARSAPDETVVRVDWSPPTALLTQWQSETEVAFIPGTPWRWQAADASALERATNLLQGELALVAPGTRSSLARALVPAMVFLLIAAGVHVIATMAQWSLLKIEAWRSADMWAPLGLSAGLPRESLESPATVHDALRRRHADILHNHRLTISDDALPLMARTSPAIARLPPGALKRASYADGHWTLEIAAPNLGPSLPDLEARLRQANLDALVVMVPGGARVRLGAPS